jgi:hypothetical protein
VEASTSERNLERCKAFSPQENNLEEMVMAYQSIRLRNEDLPPTKPAFQVADDRAFTLGAWAGVCFALAVIAGAAVILVTPAAKSNQPVDGQHAWAPTITLPQAN